MNRIKFIGIISGTIGVVGTTAYLLSDRTNLGKHIQFILRTGYLKNYPQPVSLRRPIARFIQI